MAAPLPGGPTQIRRHNERQVLEAVLRIGAVSRAQLARATGLSKPTMSLTLARLEAAGLLREVGRTSGGRGATAVLYDLEPTAGYVLAMDVGRRWVRVVLADITGKVLAHRGERTQVRHTDDVVDQLARLGRELTTEVDVPAGRLVTATLASPGVVLPEGDHVRLSPNLPGLQRRGAVERLRRELGVDLRVENDVNLAAMAELAFGRGVEQRDFVYLSVGTGVGMALVLDGVLRRGATGSAGEVGYLPLPAAADGAARSARSRGAFESHAATDGFVRAARRAGMRSARTAQQVVARARAGDSAALAAIEYEAEVLALGVAAVTAVVDPGLVVLGGGLGLGAADLLIDPLARALRPLSPVRPRIVASAVGSDAVLRGALATSLLAAQDAVYGGATGHDGVGRLHERAYHIAARITDPLVPTPREEP